MDRTAVQALVDEIGEHEGSDGIESVVANGYRGDLSADVLAECGDPSVARRAIESECQARVGRFAVYAEADEPQPGYDADGNPRGWDVYLSDVAKART